MFNNATLSRMPVSKKEWLINQNEEEDGNASLKDYTVAVVDNPLYAENEGDVDAYMKELGEDEEELEVIHYFMYIWR